MNLTALVPAAGNGTRIGGTIRKQYMLLNGAPIIVHTLRTLADIELINNIILIVPPEDINYCKKEISKYNIPKTYKIIPGGKSRGDSVYAGVCALPDETDTVLIHDGARPFIHKKEIEKAIKAMNNFQAAVIGIPLSDTLKICDENMQITSSPDRNKLWSAQTPQIFTTKLLEKAHNFARKNNISATDDASLVEQMGIPVLMIKGSYENIKITTPFDLLVAEAIFKNRATNESN